MAQGNLLQGQGAGKVGDLVFMVRQGVQVARVYTKAGARSGDAASEASRIQRVRFGSASNQWGAYRYVCTRMYRKGKKGNQSDYNYYVMRNAALLPYLSKQQNADGVHTLMPGLLSEGKLGRIEMLTMYSNTSAEGKTLLRVYDTQAAAIAKTFWSSKMGVLKRNLAAAYTAASKITYLFSWAPSILIEEGEQEFQSQTIQHIPVHVSLFSQTQSGENEMTVAAYFAQFFSGALADFVTAQDGSTMVDGSEVLRMTASTSDELDLIRTFAVTLFATDDNASDCYSTNIPIEGVPPLTGPYQVYFTYRTTDALRLACESYGYQSGVMRDDIAKFGNDLQQQQQVYAAHVRSLGLDLDGAGV